MLHGWELLVVALIILLLFGSKKIPELGKGLGKGIRSFKDGLAEGHAALEEAGEDEADKAEAAPKGELEAPAGDTEPATEAATDAAADTEPAPKSDDKA